MQSASSISFHSYSLLAVVSSSLWKSCDVPLLPPLYSMYVHFFIVCSYTLLDVWNIHKKRLKKRRGMKRAARESQLNIKSDSQSVSQWEIFQVCRNVVELFSTFFSPFPILYWVSPLDFCFIRYSVWSWCASNGPLFFYFFLPSCDSNENSTVSNKRAGTMVPFPSNAPHE